jgi:plasmid stabilization system protein ParE
MKRCAVVFEESAQADVRESYDWGCRVWGKREAQQWVRQLRKAVSKQLAVVPKGFPLAPEDDEFSEQIRQTVVGRYRLLFTVKGRKVHVLHVRGAYVEAIDQPEGDH